MNAKIIFSVSAIIALASYASYTSYLQGSTDQKTTTVESFRVQAQEARDREIKAQEDRQKREDNLSRALWLDCFDKATSQTGSRFATQQKNSYDCWKQNTTNINPGTVTSASSEVPPNSITLKNEPNNSTAKSNQIGSPNAGSKIHTTTQAQGVGLGKAIQGGGQVQKPAIISSPGISKQEKTKQSFTVAIEMIKRWEGLRLKAYHDYGHCSIGYGSYAKSCDEVITITEANRRLSVTVQSLIKTVQKDFPTLSSKQQGALASFAYNCHKGYNSITKNGLKYHGQWCKTAGGKRLDGLVNRRAEESAILFKN